MTLTLFGICYVRLRPYLSMLNDARADKTSHCYDKIKHNHTRNPSIVLENSDSTVGVRQALGVVGFVSGLCKELRISQT